MDNSAIVMMKIGTVRMIRMLVLKVSKNLSSFDLLKWSRQVNSQHDEVNMYDLQSGGGLQRMGRHVFSYDKKKQRTLFSGKHVMIRE